jgi:hypothetical protein
MLSSVKTRYAATVAIAAVALACAPAAASASSGEASGATGGVRYVTSTTAQLLGSVTAYGHPSYFRFRYGTSHTAVEQCGSHPSECLETSPQYAGAESGTIPKRVGQEVRDLNPAATYYYQLIVEYAGSELPKLTLSAHSGSIHSFLLSGQALHFITPRTAAAPLGSSPTLRGRLAGLGNGEVPLEVRASRYPYTAPFTTVATGATNSSGQFAVRLPRLEANTRYLVVASKLLRPLESAFTTFGAEVHVHFHASVTPRAVDRLSGWVTPAVRGEVIIQYGHRIKSGPRRGVLLWLTRFVTHTNAAGHFSITGRIRTGGKYRAYVRIGGRFSSGASSSLVLRGAPRHKHRAAAKHHHTGKHHSKKG